ncbi:MAG: hypothetical protein AB4042_03050 [Leptolyngbyaceae cyanobacterium]
MNRSQLPLTDEVRFCVSGNVNIHPSAAIATNVVLHANPGSTIEIGSGVVLGQGSIIHAYDGSLVLEAEVTLGTQVLLFGSGTVGSHSCIGSMTTLMGHIQVEPGTSVPPHSLQGAPDPITVAPPPNVDSSQNINETNHNSEKHDSMDSNGKSVENPGTGFAVANPSGVAHSVNDQSRAERLKTDHSESDQPSAGHSSTEQLGDDQLGANSADSPVQETEEAIASDDADDATDSPAPNGSAPDDASVDSTSIPEPTSPDSPDPSVVYGQASVQRLIAMMFPHRSQPLSGNGKE